LATYNKGWFFNQPLLLLFDLKCANNVNYSKSCVKHKSLNNLIFELLKYIHEKRKIMKTNEELQKDVQDAIKWEPLLNAAEIGVIVKDGVVTLTGMVDRYAKKIDAEEAAKNVVGVKAVVEKIKVHLENDWKKNDNQIADEILNIVNWYWESTKDRITVKVEDGWVTLGGELAWNYQKEAVNKAVNNIVGVTGVTNNITLKSETIVMTGKQEIENALERNWSLNDKHIQVQVLGNTVTLIGTVYSLFQKKEAERIAWNGPGVLSVVNELLIEYV